MTARFDPTSIRTEALGPGEARSLAARALVGVIDGAVENGTAAPALGRSLAGEWFVTPNKDGFAVANVSRQDAAAVVVIDGLAPGGHCAPRYIADDELNGRLCAVAGPGPDAGVFALDAPFALYVTRLFDRDTIVCEPRGALLALPISGDLVVGRERLAPGMPHAVDSGRSVRLSTTSAAHAILIETVET